MKSLVLLGCLALVASPAAGETAAPIHESAVVKDPLMRQIQRRLLREGSAPTYVAVRGEKGQTIAVPLVDLSAAPASLLSPLAAATAADALSGLRPEAALLARQGKKTRDKPAIPQLKRIDQQKKWGL